MNDGKVRLPVIRNAPLLSPESEGVKFSISCFNASSGSRIAAGYHARGLEALHRGYWAGDERNKMDYFNRAFGFFHLALRSEKDYFCSREALTYVAGLLGLEDLADSEEYDQIFRKGPGSNEAVHGRNPDRQVCHLIHLGFYSADSLQTMLESLQR